MSWLQQQRQHHHQQQKQQRRQQRRRRGQYNTTRQINDRFPLRCVNKRNTLLGCSTAVAGGDDNDFVEHEPGTEKVGQRCESTYRAGKATAAAAAAMVVILLLHMTTMTAVVVMGGGKISPGLRFSACCENRRSPSHTCPSLYCIWSVLCVYDPQPLA